MIVYHYAISQNSRVHFYRISMRIGMYRERIDDFFDRTFLSSCAQRNVENMRDRSFNRRILNSV